MEGIKRELRVVSLAFRSSDVRELGDVLDGQDRLSALTIYATGGGQ